MGQTTLQIRVIPYTQPLTGRALGAIAFDLEMANSFSGEPAVICMIGTEFHRPEDGVLVAETATITDKADEAALVDWFVNRLRQLENQLPQAHLLSFSGLENDLPWVLERLDRFGMDGQAAYLRAFPHCDLKAVFYERTFNSQISLKNLESAFGIERESAMQSRKVSYILTDVLREGEERRAIPEKIFHYLSEDVHNLMLIHQRWDEVDLEDYWLADEAFGEMVESLLRVSRKMASGLDKSRNGRKEEAALEAFNKALGATLAHCVKAKSFLAFQLPPFPAAPPRHQETERLRKKHARLAAITPKDPQTGAYRLKPTLALPTGALAVVRHQGRLLMIRRAAHLERAPGMWGLPGGAVHPGEPPAQAACRELLEELRLPGKPLRTLGTSLSYTGAYRLFWVEVEVEDGAYPTPAEQEVAEARWVAPEELRLLEPVIPGALEQMGRILGRPWRRD